eukprot:CAMPEP_0185691020 /NCGR_PEP_ID=MMETSP1164-20130828/1517_1 /TAXON_ID=1104430 /ORGANISM="Chrysoreinhardia sp, Strain CCMP2950" /LENGTH=183 /DNA_ID=CAMNT_0028357643 /DNA_START=163 /DNA_END=710 /DNA_ORIENTATION=-
MTRRLTFGRGLARKVVFDAVAGSVACCGGVVWCGVVCERRHLASESRIARSELSTHVELHLAAAVAAASTGRAAGGISSSSSDLGRAPAWSEHRVVGADGSSVGRSLERALVADESKAAGVAPSCSSSLAASRDARLVDDSLGSAVGADALEALARSGERDARAGHRTLVGGHSVARRALERA